MRRPLALLLLLGGAVSAVAQPIHIHVFVALCDNQHQGIVPVPAALGNGQDPANNLYWGAQFGVKTFLDREARWTRTHLARPADSVILQRAVYRHENHDALLIASAYDGRHIRTAIADFFRAATGPANLVVYVGHNGLMEFEMPGPRTTSRPRGPDAMVLACSSREFFTPTLRRLHCTPRLLTTGFMAPEAYTLITAVECWLQDRPAAEIRAAAADAYHQYQRCGRTAALRLFHSE